LIGSALRRLGPIITVVKPEKERNVSPLDPARLDEVPFDGGPGGLVEKRAGPTAEIPQLHDGDRRFGRSQHMADTVEIDILRGSAASRGHSEAHQAQDPNDPDRNSIQKRPHVVR
jgi:hypothetical protein